VGSADGNIRVYAFDVTTHVLDLVGTTPAGNNPSFLAVSPDRRMVFAVDESIPGKLTSFTVDPVTGKLKNLQSGFGSGGSRPAHLSVDRAGRALLVAHHTSGTVRVFPRGKNGGLLVPSDFRSFGASAETHQIVTDPSNAFVLVPNSGLDSVSVFRLLDGGLLADAGAAPAGDGARHVDFTPDGRRAYVVNEHASSVSPFAFDPETGALTSLGPEVSSRAAGATGDNTGAEIQVTPDGKHVLCSNRGDDDLAVFDIDAATGSIARRANVSTGGATPRHFHIEQTGRFVFVSNQGSGGTGSVVVMKLDPQTGVPVRLGAPLTLPSPGYAGLLYLDP
jgi:6-phosphogluconolactonase (cycloisomerase 2 family)